MPVPSTIDDLSPTPGSNYPAGSESPAGIDDYLRFHAACIAKLRDGKAAENGAGASGTWGISISGNAATATNATNATNATTAANVSRSVSTAGLATGGGALTADRTITVPKSSQAQAEAGTDDATAMTPLRTAQAIAALSKPIGVDQTWQDVTRTSGTDYQNTTGRPIMVCCTYGGRLGRTYVGASTASYVQIGGATDSPANDGNARYVHTFIVPAGHYYKMNGGIHNVAELR